MPLNNFSTGRDISVTLTTPLGQVDLSGLTDFSMKQVSQKIKSKGIDGTPRHATIIDGWSGSFKLDRLNGNVDRFFAAKEAGYFAGQNLQGGTMLVTIIEVDASFSQYRFTGVEVSFDDAGGWAGDKRVEQSISYEAERRIQVV